MLREFCDLPHDSDSLCIRKLSALKSDVSQRIFNYTSSFHLYIFINLKNVSICQCLSITFFARLIYIWSAYAVQICLNDGRYTQLVEQFAAVSYGDELFGHFLLVPLQQRHSPSFRKLVWSEHAAVLRVLRTRPEQVMLHILLLELL
jgi:hypothetical protein